ncbi:uncharacterized protein [Apostichopus japonicus]|uniref:uncharacterized protein isoform X2 n=1 Tax=Stichopus japonicus TaxID=307972 RepID=UPI003AB2259B
MSSAQNGKVVRMHATGTLCEFDPCPSGERCFERTALGAAPYACECAPPGGIGFDCLNTLIPYTELFTCYGRQCTSASFSTPNFPSAYPTNYRAVYLIFVPGGEEITFQLGFPYDIGPGDFLYVGRGLDFTGTDLLRPSISGEFYRFGTGDGTFVPFTLLGDAFWMYFVSDTTNTELAEGFGIVWTVRMVTTQGPEILNCPADLAITGPANLNQVTVTWIPPTSSDSTAVASSNRSPGDLFDVPSETTVMYTFTTAGGESTCSFLIVIRDPNADAPPVVSNCPTPINTVADDAFSGALVDWRAPDVTDDSAGMLTISQSHTPPEFFAIGDHSVTYTFTDSAGNTATCNFMVTVSDVTAPSFTRCPSAISVTTASTEGMTVTWQPPTATDNSAQVTVTSMFDSGDFFDLGVTTVTYRAIDSSGNAATCEFTVTVSGANQPTDIAVSGCPGDITETAVNGEAFMFVTWTPPTGVDLITGQNVVPTSSVQPNSFFRVGTETVVRYTFLSSSGQSEICSFRIMVVAGGVDDLRVVGCSNDIVEIAPQGFNFVTVAWTVPSAVDQFNNILTGQSATEPGNYFEVGTTTRITYNFMDNFGNTAVCSFLVTVQSVGDQLIIEGCPNTVQETIALGSATVSAVWTPPTVSANAIGDVQVFSNFQPGDQFPPGETTVTYSFTDTAGSTGICIFTVIVSEATDVTPPTLLCPSTISRSIPASQQCAIVTWQIPFVEDDSGANPEVISAPPSGSCLDPGITDVTVTATDPSGNVATCVFAVFVTTTDNVPPTLTCPESITRTIPLENGCVDVIWTIPFVSDDSGGQVDVMSTPASGTCFPVNSVMNVLVTGMDPSGNVATCQFSVTVTAADVVDNFPPFVLCPNDFTRSQPVEQRCTEITWDIPFVQDDSGEVTTVSAPPSGTCFEEGINDVMVTAIDPSGNTDVCGFSVTVIGIDVDPPTLRCPGDISREVAASDGPCVAVSWEIPFVSDNSGRNVDVVSSPPSGTCFFIGTVTNVLVTAEDPSGNVANCQFIVTVTAAMTVDTTPPTILCPDDIFRDVPVESPCTQVSWEVPFVSDDSGGNVAISSQPPSGDCFVAGIHPVIVSAVDPSGNRNNCSFVITLNAVDNQPPSVICPSNINRNIDITAPCLEVTWEIPFTSDNSQGTVTTVSSPPSGSCLPAGTRTVTVTATDPAGNQNSCQFAVTLTEIDNIPPSIECPQDITMNLQVTQECREVTWVIPSVMDNSGGVVNVISDPISGTCFFRGATVVAVTATDPFNNMNTCSFVVRVIMNDPCAMSPCLNGGTCVNSQTGNQAFTCLCTVGFDQADCGRDVQPPSLTCPEDIVSLIGLRQDCAMAIWEVPAATDNSMDNLIIRSSPPSGTCFSQEVTTVEVTASDLSGNVNRCTFTVTVMMEVVEPPTVVCPQNIQRMLTGDECTTVDWTIPFAVGGAGRPVDVQSEPPSGFCFVPGVVEVVVTATDDLGNSANCMFSVTVNQEDNTPPVIQDCPLEPILITLPADTTCTPIIWMEPTATDDDNFPPIVQRFPAGLDCFAPGEVTFTYVFSDQANNFDICAFSVIITQGQGPPDTTAPVVLSCPGDLEAMIEVPGDCVEVTWDEPIATDDSVTIIQGEPTFDPGFCFLEGVNSVLYTFMDPSGNTAMCIFDVTVRLADTVPPVVTGCPNAILLDATTVECTPVTWLEPQATDAISAVVSLDLNFSPGSCFPVGSTTVLYTFSDAAGNSASCQFTVTIRMAVDVTPPVIQNCPTDPIEVTIPAGEACTPIVWVEPTATDDDGFPPMVQRFPDAIDCFTAGQLMFTYIFIDQSNNFDLCSFSVIITSAEVPDTTDPVVISCPTEVEGTIPPSDTCVELSWPEPLASDDSVPVIRGVSNFEPGSCFFEGTTTVIYTFTDPSGNSVTCTFDVIVQITEAIPPVVTGCPDTIQQDANPTGPCTRIFWTEPTAVDAVSGNPMVDRNFSPGDCFVVGTTVVVYTFTDAAGNQATCLFNVVVDVIDIDPPIILGCPDDIVRTANPSGECVRVFWMVPVAIDVVSGIPLVVNNFDPGFCFGIGVTTVVYTFSDASGNEASCQFSVRIGQGDNIPPEIQGCPQDISITAQPGSECQSVFWSIPSATDNSMGPLEVDSSGVEPGDCFPIGTETVTYTFTDLAQNSATCIFTVEVAIVDNEPPLIGLCPDDIRSETDSITTCVVVIWSEPFAVDAISGIPSLRQNFFSGDCFNVGRVLVTYRFTDEAGNTATCDFTVTVEVRDSSAPVIVGCPNDITQQSQTFMACTVVTWREPAAFDDQPGDISMFSSHDSGDCFRFGRTVVTYSFTDVAANTATCSFAVTIVVDTLPPVITGCPQDVSEFAAPGASCARIFWTEPSATDDFSGTPTLDRNFSPGFCFPLGESEVSYTFVDTSGNVATCEFLVTISRRPDFIPPTIEGCPSDIRLPGPANVQCQSVVWMVPTATDNLPGVVSVSSSYNPGDCFPFGDTVVIYTFTDLSLNRATCAFIVNVFLVDVTPPTVTDCPSDIVLQGSTGSPCQVISWREPVAVDESGGFVSVQRSNSPGECFMFGSTLVRYTFTDAAGNQARCTFSVQINFPDTVPPVISNCPEDITLQSSMTEGCLNVNWIEPTATDDTSVPILLERSHAPGLCLPGGSTLVTYRFADLEGNEQICSFIVQVNFRDNEPPTVIGCPSDITLVAEGNAPCVTARWTDPFVVDNGPGEVVTTQTSMSGNCFALGDTLVSYIFTDSSGNIATCTFNVNIFRIDVIPPVISNCPADITLEAFNNDQCVSVNWIEPFGVDESPGDVTIRDRTSRPGDCFPVGETVVTYVFRDVAGNTAICTFTINITPRDDNPPVVISCPNDMSLELLSNSQCLVVTWGDPIVIDDRTGQIATTQTAFSGECFPVGIRNVLYTFTDVAGNSATCTFTVTIVRRDDTPPEISNCPTDIMLLMTPNTECLAVSWIEPTARDSSPPITRTVTHPTGTCFEQGLTTVTYSFVDAVGNIARCSFDVSIQILDTVPPRITFCPNDITQNSPVPGGCTVVTFPEPTAVDESNGQLTVIQSHRSGDCFQTGSTTAISYVFLDPAGNRASCTFSVRIDVPDTQLPVISGCPSNIMLTLPVGQTCITTVWVPPTATDNNGQVTSTSSVDPNTCFSEGTNPIVYIFTDSSGNSAMCTFFIIVLRPVDITPPVVVTCPDSFTIMLPPGQNCIAVRWIEPLVTDDSGTVSVLSQTINQNDCLQAGNNLVAYTFVDPSGNMATCQFTVQVDAVDITPPVVVTCPDSFTIMLPPGQNCIAVRWIEPLVTDDSGTVSILSQTINQNNCLQAGNNLVAYTFVDPSGNPATCQFTVQVNTVDVTPPVVVTCPDSFTIMLPPGQNCIAVRWIEPLVTDDSGTVSILSQTINQNNCLQAGNNLVAYTFVDPSGNTATCQFTVQVNTVDVTSPVVETCPESFSIMLPPGQACITVRWIEPSVTDDSGIVNVDSLTIQQNTCLNAGDNQVMYIFSDPSGNLATCAFTITVTAGVDVTSPVLSPCPTDETVFVTTEPCQQVVWTPPTATDDSGLVTVETDSPLGTCFPIGQTLVTYTAMDPAGNTDMCSFTVDVIIDQPPVVSDCPMDINVGVPVGDTCATVTWTEPTVVDDRGAVNSIPPTMTPGTCLMEGIYSLVYIFSDSSNLVSICNFLITVTAQQDVPPVVDGCPMDIDMLIPTTATCTGVNWQTPTATDDTGPVVTTPPSTLPGMCLTAGVYDIVYVFTDQSNQETRCSFVVTVRQLDNEPPLVTGCPTEDVIAFAQTGSNTVVTWIEPTAVDNSGLEVIIVQNASPGMEFPIGDFSVTYTFTDPAGNAATCQFVVSVVEDNQPPMIMGCPMDFITSVSNTDGGQVFTWMDPTATDNSGRPVTMVINGPAAGMFFPIGTNTMVQYIFTDEAGNVATCAFNILVQVSADPLVVSGCSENLILSAVPGEVATVGNWATPTATGVLPITVVEPTQQSGDLLPFGTTEILYRFTDGNGAMQECRFSITVLVTPIVPNCPASFTVDAPPGSMGTIVDWAEPIPMGVEPFQVSMPLFNPGDFLPVGDTLIVYVFTDNVGGMVNCEFTVTVNVLATLMIVDCPMSQIIEAAAGQSVVTAMWTIPTASGFEPVILTNAPAFIPEVTPIPVGMDVDLVYTFTDGLGNMADCMFTISTRDVTPPTFTMPCPTSPVEQIIGPMDVNTMVTWVEPTAEDDIPGSITTTVSPTSNIFTEGNTLVTYTLSDQAGNSIMCSFVVSVIVDVVPPVVTFCPMDIVVNADPNLNGMFVNWMTPTAADNVELSPDVVITGGNPNTFFPVGVAIITYTFSDIFENTVDCVFMVEVVGDRNQPVITGCPNMPITAFTPLGVPRTVDWMVPTAVDTDGGPITTMSTHTPNESLFLPDTSTTVSYTFSDIFQNQATCDFSVVVIVDNQPPTVMGCPGPIIIDLDRGLTQFPAQWIAPTGTDNSNLPVTVELNGPSSGSLFSIGETLITYVITDTVGLQSLCVFTVTVNDVTPPQVINCPTAGFNVFTNDGPVFVDIPVLQVTDDTGLLPTLVSQNVPDQQIFPVGNTALSFTYTDGNGNFVTCQFSVLVQLDTTAPVVTCPDPIQVFVPEGMPSVVVNYADPMVSDDSGLTPTLVAAIGMPSGGLFPAGRQEVVAFQYADAAGNLGSCTLTITVTVDTTPPVVMSCEPTAMAFASATANQAVVTFPEPSATDNSGLDVTLSVDGPRSGSVFPVGDSSTIYTFTDSVGLRSFCQVIVTVEVDSTPPTISGCSMDMTSLILNTEFGAEVIFDTPTATDNSMEMSILVLVSGVNANNIYPIGITDISYTFLDNYGNDATCQFSITVVQDVCNPSVCNINEVCTSDGQTPPSAVCTPTASPCESDPCIPGQQSCFETNNGFFCQDLPDTTPPVISGCPTSTIQRTIPADAATPFFVDIPVPTATDNRGEPSVSVIGLPADSSFPEGPTSVIYTFSDTAGNSVTCVINVNIVRDVCNPNPCNVNEMCASDGLVPATAVCTVIASPCESDPCIPGQQSCFETNNGFFCQDLPDIAPPVITGCPTDTIARTIPANTAAPFFVDIPVPTATDNRGVPSVSVTGLPADSSFPEGPSSVIYTFSDTAGNSVTCVINVFVDIDYCNPNPCGAGVVCTEGAVNPSVVVCEGVCTAASCPIDGEFCFLQGNIPTCLPIGLSPLLTDCPANAYFAFTNADLAVFDVPVPSLTNFPGQAVNVVQSPTGNTFPIASFTEVTFTLLDDAGVTVTTCTVTVAGIPDVTAPVVTSCPDARNTIQTTTVPRLVVLPEPTATDANGVTTQITGRPDNDFYPLGPTTVTYTFSDPAGNTNECVFTIDIVVDICIPTPCLANQNCRADTSPNGFTCIDICDINTCPNQLCFNDIGITTGSPCVPVPSPATLGNCPMETVFAEAPFGTTTATVVLPVPFLLDFPDYPTSIVQTPLGDVYNVGQTTSVTLSLNDNAGTVVAVCTRNVQVTAAADNSFRLVDCPPNTIVTHFVAPGTTTSRVFFNEPSTVGGQGEVTLTTGDFTSGSSFSTGFGTATYTFIDGVGQTLTCTRTIVVLEDTIAPVITGCTSPAITTVDRNTDSAFVELPPEPQATDNSNLEVTVTRDGIPPNNIFPVGTMQVDYVFTDPFGNSDTCMILVTVEQDLCNPNPCPDNGICTQNTSPEGFSCAAAVTCDTITCPPGEACLEIGQMATCLNVGGRKKRSMESPDGLELRKERAASLDGNNTSGQEMTMLSHVYVAVVSITTVLLAAIVLVWIHLKSRRRVISTESGSC